MKWYTNPSTLFDNNDKSLPLQCFLESFISKVRTLTINLNNKQQ